jgi:hypothetical protein
MKQTNETYTVRAGSPLLRPGLEVETRVSKRYLKGTLKDLLDQLREFNIDEAKVAEVKK